MVFSDAPMNVPEDDTKDKVRAGLKDKTDEPDLLPHARRRGFGHETASSGLDHECGDITDDENSGEPV